MTDTAKRCIVGDDRWGVWGGRQPGGWCHMYLPGDDSSPLGQYFGTRGRAMESAARFRSEYPGFSYDAVPYDRDREPPSTGGRPTAAQRRALELLLGNTGDGRYDASRWHMQVSRSTATALHARGWIHYRPTDDGEDSRLVVTAAGRRALRVTP